MPPRKGSGIMGFARVWRGPGKPGFVDKLDRYSLDLPNYNLFAPVAELGTGNVTSNSTGSGTNVIINKPSNTYDGDVLVAVVFSSLTSSTWTPPAGWTQQAGGNVSRSMFLFTKPIPSAAAESATNYTFAWSGGAGRGQGIIFRMTGAPTSLIDSVGAVTTSGTVSTVAPAVTTIAERTLLIGCWFTASTATPVSDITAPGSMVDVGEVSVAPAAASDLLVTAETLTVSGTTGTRTATNSPSATSGVGGFLVAFSPGMPIQGAQFEGWGIPL